MNKSVIELAKQSGFWQEHIDTWMSNTSDIEAFAEAIRNAVLEEAAMKCDQLDFSLSLCEQYVSGAASAECADQIRSMKA